MSDIKIVSSEVMAQEGWSVAWSGKKDVPTPRFVVSRKAAFDMALQGLGEPLSNSCKGDAARWIEGMLEATPGTRLYLDGTHNVVELTRVIGPTEPGWALKTLPPRL